MEEPLLEDYKEAMEEAEEIKKGNIGVNTTTEALLLMIHQELDSIRFHQG